MVLASRRLIELFENQHRDRHFIVRGFKTLFSNLCTPNDQISISGQAWYVNDGSHLSLTRHSGGGTGKICENGQYSWRGSKTHYGQDRRCSYVVMHSDIAIDWVTNWLSCDGNEFNPSARIEQYAKRV